MSLCGKAQELALGEQAAFDNAGVVALVAEHVFAFADQRADDAEVDLETGAVEQHGLLVDQFGQGRFQLQVDVQRAVQEPRAGAAGAVFLHRRPGGLLDLGMVGQAQVAVGTQHEDLLALDDDLGVLRGGNGAKIGVQPHFPQLGGGFEVPGLVQQCARLRGAVGLCGAQPGC